MQMQYRSFLQFEAHVIVLLELIITTYLETVHTCIHVHVHRCTALTYIST